MIIIKSKQSEEELEAEILRILKREHIDAEQFFLSSQYQFSFRELTIDGKSQQVLQNGRQVALTRIEFNLLVFLAVHAGRVLSKEELFCAVWGHDSEDTMKVVANTVSNLRKKIQGGDRDREYIRTVRGGYIFGDDSLAYALPEQ